MGFLFSGLETEAYDRQYSDTQMIKRIFWYMSPYKFWIFLTVLFILISTIFNILLPQALTQGIDALINGSDFNALLLFALAYLVIGVLVFFSELGRMYSNVKFTANGVKDIRNIAFKQINELDQSFYDKNRTGRIMARVSDDIEQLEEFLGLSSQFLALITITVGTFTVLMLISPHLTLIALCVVPALVVVTLVFRKYSKKLT